MVEDKKGKSVKIFLMLSAHNSNSISKENDYHVSLLTFLQGKSKKTVIVEVMMKIKHKKQLEEAKAALTLIFSNLSHDEVFSAGMKLLDIFDSLKDSLALALGNQVCFYFARNEFPCSVSFLPSSVVSTLKKLIVLNYMLAKRTTL